MSWPTANDYTVMHAGRENLPFAPDTADHNGASNASEHPARRVRTRPLPVAGLLARGSPPQATFPGSIVPVVSMAIGSSLTVAGAAAALSVYNGRTAFPQSPCGHYRWQSCIGLLAGQGHVAPGNRSRSGLLCRRLSGRGNAVCLWPKAVHAQDCRDIGRELSHTLNKDFHQARPWRPEKNP